MENREIENLVREYLHEEVVSLSELKHKRVYLVETEKRKCVVKITKLEWAVDEVFFLHELQKINVPSPNLFSYGLLNDKEGFLIIEYKSDCKTILDDELRINDVFWHQLAEGMKKMHEVPVSGFGFNTSRVFGKENFTASSFKEFIEWVLMDLEKHLSDTSYLGFVTTLKQKSVLLINHAQAYLAHGDLGGNNFLWNETEAKLYFFDPSYFRGMPKTWDIAYFGWRTGEGRVTDKDVQKLTSLYFGGNPDTYDVFEIAFLRALTGLIKIRDALKTNTVKEEYVSAVQKQIHLLDT